MPVSGNRADVMTASSPVALAWITEGRRAKGPTRYGDGRMPGNARVPVTAGWCGSRESAGSELPAGLAERGRGGLDPRAYPGRGGVDVAYPRGGEAGLGGAPASYPQAPGIIRRLPGHAAVTRHSRR